MRVLIFLLLLSPPLFARDSAPQWELVFNEDFSQPSALDSWKLDGAAKVSITPDGMLLIETIEKEINGEKTHCSVLWYSQPFRGDLRFVFDGKAEPSSRCIFFFNAQPRRHESIFDWSRPLARYGDYAWDDRIELYTLGILRSDQTIVNLRHLGDALIERWKKLDTLPKRHPERKRIYREFQEKTILASYTSPFDDPDKVYHFDLRVVGNRISLAVDGKQMFDIVDSERAGKPLRGGYFGFRNFKPTRAWYDNLRVYKLIKD